MYIIIQCGHCTATIRAPDRASGKSVRCPQCGSGVAVGQPASPPKSQDRVSRTLTDDDVLGFLGINPSGPSHVPR
ncbi:MAG TPA: hypothetical protein VGX76_09550 [Pirellulales bacterium]|jgi:DNA-directed RNA polymerase subunit RPC12/RpoP|nr:hypothetical protein [Pirellulales bacterium]